MTRPHLLALLTLLLLFSCKSEKPAENDTYIVNAGKMIGINRNNYTNVEPQLINKAGYRYTTAAAGIPIKAEVHLPALDDSNRVVPGNILLNIALDNRVQFAMFTTDAITQQAAYAMMLNYHRATLQLISGITFSIGEVIESGVGGNVQVSVVLSKLTTGQLADQLAITYNCAGGEFSMAIFKQPDGRFIFSYRGS